MSGRYGGRGRSTSAPRGARWMDLYRPGRCEGCGRDLAKGDRAFWDPSDRLVCCTAITCADRFGLTREDLRGVPGQEPRWVKVLAERRIMSASEPVTGAPRPERAARSSVIRFSSGATFYRNVNGRCEDAPCCGCCTI